MSDHNLHQPDDHTAADARVVSLLHEMLRIHVDNVDCMTCGDSIDCLAELVAAGQDAKKAWPAIYTHLKCCRHCNEEFQALLAVLKAEREGKLDEIG